MASPAPPPISPTAQALHNVDLGSCDVDLTRFVAGPAKDSDQDSSDESQEASRSPSQPPTELCCPISCDLMADPVIAEDGNTYDRASIQSWFGRGNATSPITREAMSVNVLIPNRAIMSLIREYCSKKGLEPPGSQTTAPSASSTSSPAPAQLPSYPTSSEAAPYSSPFVASDLQRSVPPDHQWSSALGAVSTVTNLLGDLLRPRSALVSPKDALFAAIQAHHRSSGESFRMARDSRFPDGNFDGSLPHFHRDRGIGEYDRGHPNFLLRQFCVEISSFSSPVSPTLSRSDAASAVSGMIDMRCDLNYFGGKRGGRFSDSSGSLFNPFDDAYGYRKNFTLVHECARIGNTTMLSAILDRGASVDGVVVAGGDAPTPLQLAVVYHKPSAVKLLMNSGANVEKLWNDLDFEFVHGKKSIALWKASMLGPAFGMGKRSALAYMTEEIEKKEDLREDESGKQWIEVRRCVEEKMSGEGGGLNYEEDVKETWGV